MRASPNHSLHAVKIDRGALAEKVASVLRRAIVQGKFVPGERLPEIWLSKQLGVSRAPIREAFRILGIEGLVEVIPQKGARVRGLTSRDVENIYELRSALDSLAVRLAIPQLQERDFVHLQKLLSQMKSYLEKGDNHSYQRLNSEFHDLFYQRSQNQWLCDVYNGLMKHIMRLRSFSLSLSGRLTQSYKEHIEIIEAIKSNKIREAEELSGRHTQKAGRALLQLYFAKKKETSLEDSPGL